MNGELNKKAAFPGWYGVFVYQTKDDEFLEDLSPDDTFEFKKDAIEEANSIWNEFSQEEKAQYYIEVWKADDEGLFGVSGTPEFELSVKSSLNKQAIDVRSIDTGVGLVSVGDSVTIQEYDRRYEGKVNRIDGSDKTVQLNDDTGEWYDVSNIINVMSVSASLNKQSKYGFKVGDKLKKEGDGIHTIKEVNDEKGILILTKGDGTNIEVEQNAIMMGGAVGIWKPASLKNKAFLISDEEFKKRITDDITKNLEIDVDEEKNAIKIYQAHIDMCKDKYPHIAKLLEHIIEEEKHHIKELSDQIKNIDKPLEEKHSSLVKQAEADSYNIPNRHIFDKAQVFDSAQVFGNAKIYGNAQVYGNARVYDDAQILDNAEVYGHVQIYGKAQIFNNAEVYDYAQVYDNAWVFENAYVFGNAKIYGKARIFGNARVCGDAEVCDNARIAGYVDWGHWTGEIEADLTWRRVGVIKSKIDKRDIDTEVIIFIGNLAKGQNIKIEIPKETEDIVALFDQLIARAQKQASLRTIATERVLRDKELKINAQGKGEVIQFKNLQNGNEFVFMDRLDRVYKVIGRDNVKNELNISWEVEDQTKTKGISLEKAGEKKVIKITHSDETIFSNKQMNKIEFIRKQSNSYTDEEYKGHMINYRQVSSDKDDCAYFVDEDWEDELETKEEAKKLIDRIVADEMKTGSTQSELKVGDHISVNLSTGEEFGEITEIKDGQAGVSFYDAESYPKVEWFDIDLVIKQASSNSQSKQPNKKLLEERCRVNEITVGEIENVGKILFREGKVGIELSDEYLEKLLTCEGSVREDIKNVKLDGADYIISFGTYGRRHDGIDEYSIGFCYELDKKANVLVVEKNGNVVDIRSNFDINKVDDICSKLFVNLHEHGYIRDKEGKLFKKSDLNIK